jgi:hypothetical protein
LTPEVSTSDRSFEIASDITSDTVVQEVMALKTSGQYTDVLMVLAKNKRW